jgi:lipopolysaccharide export system protein LptC
VQGDGYSRLISLLKVVFPLAALGLLSTIFLLSRSIDPTASIPFADDEIRDRLRDQQITGPFFSGATTNGDQLSFYADRLAIPDGQIGANRAEGVKARIETSDGALFTLQSSTADFDVARDNANLEGDVILTSSQGYRIVTDKLESDISTLQLVSPGPIVASSPAGTIEAGGMRIDGANGDQATQLVFTNRVKLVYTPSKTEE